MFLLVPGDHSILDKITFKPSIGQVNLVEHNITKPNIKIFPIYIQNSGGDPK